MKKQKLILNAIPHALLSSIYALLGTVPLAPWLVLLHAWITDDYLLNEATEPVAHAFGWFIAAFLGGAICLGWLIPFSLSMAKTILNKGFKTPFLISNVVLFSALGLLLAFGDVNWHHFWDDSMSGGVLLASIPLGILGQFFYFKLFTRGLQENYGDAGVKNLGCKTGKSYAAPLSLAGENVQGKRFCRVRETAYSSN